MQRKKKKEEVEENKEDDEDEGELVDELEDDEEETGEEEAGEEEMAQDRPRWKQSVEGQKGLRTKTRILNVMKELTSSQGRWMRV